MFVRLQQCEFVQKYKNGSKFFQIQNKLCNNVKNFYILQKWQNFADSGNTFYKQYLNSQFKRLIQPQKQNV